MNIYTSNCIGTTLTKQYLKEMQRAKLEVH